MRRTCKLVAELLESRDVPAMVVPVAYVDHTPPAPFPPPPGVHISLPPPSDPLSSTPLPLEGLLPPIPVVPPALDIKPSDVDAEPDTSPLLHDLAPPPAVPGAADPSPSPVRVTIGPVAVPQLPKPT